MLLHPRGIMINEVFDIDIELEKIKEIKTKFEHFIIELVERQYLINDIDLNDKDVRDEWYNIVNRIIKEEDTSLMFLLTMKDKAIKNFKPEVFKRLEPTLLKEAANCLFYKDSSLELKLKTILHLIKFIEEQMRINIKLIETSYLLSVAHS